jgi:hypothetical protein
MKKKELTPKEKIIKLTDDLGIKGVRACQLMNMPLSSYRLSLCEGLNRNKFTEEDYQELLKKVKEKIKNYD